MSDKLAQKLQKLDAKIGRIELEGRGIFEPRNYSCNIERIKSSSPPRFDDPIVPMQILGDWRIEGNQLIQCDDFPEDSPILE